MFIEVNGTRLYYEVRGEGRPLIMVHGNSEDHTIFTEAADVLDKYYQVYLVDSRDHGLSEKSDELHYMDMARDYLAFMKALKLRDVIFYGFSDGGIIGLLAAMQTSRITDLIVSGANLSPKGVSKRFRFFLRLIYPFKRDPKIRLMMKEPRINPDDLARIQCNVMVLAGSKDLIKPRETILIASSIPQARMRIISGEDHGSYIIHSTLIADLILESLGQPRKETD